MANSKRKIDPIITNDDFLREVKFVFDTIYNTSSMNEKLPNYLVDRIFACLEWGRKNVWK